MNGIMSALSVTLRSSRVQTALEPEAAAVSAVLASVRSSALLHVYWLFVQASAPKKFDGVG
jgi:hypothetical protein